MNENVYQLSCLQLMVDGVRVDPELSQVTPPAQAPLQADTQQTARTLRLRRPASNTRPTMDDLYLPVSVERQVKSSSSQVSHIREHVGTVYFRAGTTANDVCQHITHKMAARGSVGIYLLQVQVPPDEAHFYQDLEAGSYYTLRDGKYELREGNKYVAFNYTGGPDIYIG